MVFGPLPRTDPLWCVKIVHPEFTTEDLRTLSEAPRAEDAGVYPAAAGTGKEVFEFITVWNSQCNDYSFEELRFVHSYLRLPYSSTTLNDHSCIASASLPSTIGPESHILPLEKLASNALLQPARTSFLDTKAPPKGLMACATSLHTTGMEY